MWDTVENVPATATHLSHDAPCVRCGHGTHTFLPCSDTCDCPPPVEVGAAFHGSTAGRSGLLALT
jgi:hypothetical protein